MGQSREDRGHQAGVIPVEALGLLLLAAVAWLWLDSIKVREAAVAAARSACASEGLMLLDDTVSISGLKPARNDEGHVRLQRSYDFEFSDTGNNRRKGSVVLLGRRVVLFNIGVTEHVQS
jgi:hypothetical protein